MRSELPNSSSGPFGPEDPWARNFNELARLSTALGAANACSQQLAAYDSVFNSTLSSIKGLLALSTDYERVYSGLGSPAKTMADTSKFSGLLGREDTWQKTLDELARPLTGLGALSTDYLRMNSVLDPVAKSLADTSEFSGLSALSTDYERMYSGIGSLAKTMAETSRLSGLLGQENAWQKTLDELARPSLGLGALTVHGQQLAAYDSVFNSTLSNVSGLSALSKDYLQMNSVLDPVAQSLADPSRVSGLLGALDYSWQDKLNELTRPITGLGALSIGTTRTKEQSVETRESDSIDNRGDDDFIRVLLGLNPALPELWKGAHAALRSGGADWVRHVAVSLRELLTHAMHYMAPDREMEEWIRKAEYRSEKGRPTRLARLHFIVAPGIDALEPGEVNELQEIVEFFQDLQDHTHRLKNASGRCEIRQVIARAERFISMLAARHLEKKKLH